MLVVGRFSLKGPTKQGTPVQDRDGPAAVTEGFRKLIRAIVDPGAKGPGHDEKASFPNSEVRRPTNALPVEFREGRMPRIA